MDVGPSGNAGGAAFDRSGAVELGGGREDYKIEALTKLTIFLAGLHISKKIFVCHVEQRIAMRLVGGGGSR